MKNAHLTDFAFIGLGVVPAVMAYAGLPDIAILLFVLLLIASCLCGMHEQALDGAAGKPDTKTGAGDDRPHLPTTFMERRRTPDA